MLLCRGLELPDGRWKGPRPTDGISQPRVGIRVALAIQSERTWPRAAMAGLRIDGEGDPRTGTWLDIDADQFPRGHFLYVPAIFKR